MIMSFVNCNETIELGRSRLTASRLGLGTWVFGKTHWGQVHDEESIATIHFCIDHGIQLIDTAPIYGFGHAEKIVGQAIKGRREQVVLATKCGLRKTARGIIKDLSPELIRSDLENSLRQLNVDYIDLYQIHWPDPDHPLEETLELLSSFQSKGLIREIGLCNHALTDLIKINDPDKIASIQNPYSLLNPSIEKDLIPWANGLHIPVIVYGLLQGGLLTGKYQKRPSPSKKTAKAFFYHIDDPALWEKAQAILPNLEKLAVEHGLSLVAEVVAQSLQKTKARFGLVGLRNREQAKVLLAHTS